MSSLSSSKPLLPMLHRCYRDRSAKRSTHSRDQFGKPKPERLHEDAEATSCHRRGAYIAAETCQREVRRAEADYRPGPAAAYQVSFAETYEHDYIRPEADRSPITALLPRRASPIPPKPMPIEVVPETRRPQRGNPDPRRCTAETLHIPRRVTQTGDRSLYTTAPVHSPYLPLYLPVEAPQGPRRLAQRRCQASMRVC